MEEAAPGCFLCFAGVIGRRFIFTPPIGEQLFSVPQRGCRAFSVQFALTRDVFCLKPAPTFSTYNGSPATATPRGCALFVDTLLDWWHVHPGPQAERGSNNAGVLHADRWAPGVD